MTSILRFLPLAALLFALSSFACSSSNPEPTDAGMCTPDCASKTCGDDGCGGSCGTCGSDETCNAGTCCAPQCTGKNCGDDQCGGVCGTCATGSACRADGTCEVCTPDCTGRMCGDDGCGGSCGSCDIGLACNAAGVCEGCTADCTGKECGADGCGGVCGNCDASESCNAAGMCVAFCGNRCDNGCGPCPMNSSNSLTCTASGLCKCAPNCTADCNNKGCGDDGCGGSCGACGGAEVCTYDRNRGLNWDCDAFAGTSPTMSFFVTSQGTGPQGGNYGGLSGADARCTQFAEAAGVVGKTWRAYLSTSQQNARDRIGAGPWANAAGTRIGADGCGEGGNPSCVDAIHSDGILAESILTEMGTQLDWANAHDILTGSDSSGVTTGIDCVGWTSNSENDFGTVGHSHQDSSWAQAHDTTCDQTGLQCTAGQGMIYCFAL